MSRPTIARTVFLAIACYASFTTASDQPLPAAAMGSDQIDAATFARRIMATAELVLKRHVDPPPRQAMIAESVRALGQQPGRPAAIGVGRQVSELQGDDAVFRYLCDAWSQAHQATKLTDDELQAAALAGLLRALPERPQAIPAKEFKVQEQVRGNRYVGIGIQLGMKADEQVQLPVIINPFPRGPARVAGARAGDVILEIDGVSTKGVPLEKVVDSLRGAEGTAVTILVRGVSSDQVRSLSMIRGVVPFQSFAGFKRLSEQEWEYRPDESSPIAYLQLTAIRPSTLSELRQLAPVLESRGIQALILDFRNATSMGIDDLQNVQLVADELLDEATIGRVQDYAGTKVLRSGPDCLFKRWPIVVLVNQYTRGESEFLAAALQDNHRAVIVGDDTPGVAYLHASVELPDGLGAVSLRSGILLRGDGRPLQREYRPEDAEAEAVQAANPCPPQTAGDAKTQGQAESPRVTGQESQSSAQAKLRAIRSAVAERLNRSHGVAPDQGPMRINAGVHPDHPVAVRPDQNSLLFAWRQEQELPDPPATGRSPAPVDPQLDKAMEILRKAIKDPPSQ